VHPIQRAYRLRRRDDVWALVSEIERFGTEQARAQIELVFSAMAREVKTGSPLYQQAFAVFGRERMARAAVVDKVLARSYRMGVFDFELYVTFREYRQWVYLFQHSGSIMSSALEFLETDPRVTDFHYREDEEKPTLVAERDWLYRRRVWKYLGDRPTLTLDICRPHLYPKFNPFANPTFLQTLEEVRRPQEEVRRPSMAELIRASNNSSRTPP